MTNQRNSFLQAVPFLFWHHSLTGLEKGSLEIGMVAAAGFQEGETAVLLYQGSLGLGEIDLSKYSKIIITYTCDVENTGEAYETNTNNRIMLTNADCSGAMSPADESVIVALGDYERPYANWALMEYVFDVSALTDTTNVFVTFDFLPSAFFLVGAVELIEAPATEEAA